jgi:hypothetical protein
MFDKQCIHISCADPSNIKTKECQQYCLENKNKPECRKNEPQPEPEKKVDCKDEKYHEKCIALTCADHSNRETKECKRHCLENKNNPECKVEEKPHPSEPEKKIDCKDEKSRFMSECIGET